VLTGFFTSPEYVNQARRLSDHVELLFRVAQGRATLPDERAPHVAVLRSRLGSVADLLIGSPEFAARLRTILNLGAADLEPAQMAAGLSFATNLPGRTRS
jgi:hypothetical protein